MSAALEAGAVAYAGLPISVPYASSRTMLLTAGDFVFPVFGPRRFTRADADAMAAAIVAHGQARGEGRLIEVTMVDHDVSLPTAELLAALNAHAPTCGPYYRCFGVVYGGNGFRGSMLRGIFRTFQLLARRDIPMRIFDGVRPCAAWIHELHLDATEEASLEVLVATFEAVVGHANGRRLLPSLGSQSAERARPR